MVSPLPTTYPPQPDRIRCLRFLGIELGWENRPSGVAALDWAGETLHLASLKHLGNPEDVLCWIAAEAADVAGIGIDAPIVFANGARMRIADRLAQSYYGKYHAGSYPLKKTRTYSKTISTFSASLASLGFGHGEQRFLVEVHPHAASVQLFLLNTHRPIPKGELDQSCN